MNTDLRKSKRIPDYLPITVIAQDGVSGEKLAGPFSGRILNISKHGACLLMTQVMLGTYHLFHSTRANDSSVLLLNFSLPPDLVVFSIPSRPVWMDIFQQDVIRAFKIGVEFMVSPEGRQIKDLLRAMEKQQKERARWWEAHTA